MSQISKYSSLQSEFASFTGGQEIRETNRLLRPLRAKTAPAEDLERERRAISTEVHRDMLLAQIAIFLLLASIISYFTLPSTMAHGITFLLLCTGIATGFFLKR